LQQFPKACEVAGMQVALRDFDTSVEVKNDAVILPRRAGTMPSPVEPAAAVRSALEAPREFPPLRRALTPEDRITLLVDDHLPHLGEMVGALLKYLTEAGVAPEAITLLSPPGSRQEWVEQLPDAFQDVRTEVHDPANRQRISYLASTRAGRRIYLNRALVDADQILVLAGCHYDSQFGYADGASLLFPGLSDTETLKATSSRLSMDAPAAEIWPLRQEAVEVAWLVGVPFLIHVIEGDGDNIAMVYGGTVESSGYGRQVLDSFWRATVPQAAHTVVITVTGAAARQDISALGQAALSAARVVEPGGRILILSKANPNLSEGMTFVRDADNPAVAARIVQERQPPDRVAVSQWLHAAGKAELYLLSAMDDNVVEELFATPLQQARQIQRLLDVAPTCLFLEDGGKMLAVVE
jgi:nickel-dependent lactate racemase